MELGGNNALIVCADGRSRHGDAARFSSARSERRVSVAPPRGASSCTSRSPTRCAIKLLAAYKSVPHRQSARSQNIDGSADRSAVSRQRAAFDREGERRRRRSSLRRRKAQGRQISRRLLHDAVPGDRAARFQDRAATKRLGRCFICMTYRDFDEAIAIHNGVPQGLSSAIFTNDCARPRSSSARGERLRHRQRQHRHERRGNRRRVWRRERNRRRPRERKRFLEDLHAPADQHDQFLD